MKDIGARYDIVGFDPRFVGRSTPPDCGRPVGTSWLSVGTSRAGFDPAPKRSPPSAAPSRRPPVAR
ncbi:hypothetical protein [Streptomyces sp. NPDC053720]|uniref:hypothetical protein n=1 Tax=Streptomyces sp. NPDC053720 TaxID=3154855 RepID=UPI003417BF5A